MCYTFFETDRKMLSVTSSIGGLKKQVLKDPGLSSQLPIRGDRG